MHNLGIVRLETKEVNKLSGFPQRIPQYIEVPPNVEAKRISSCLSAVLTCSCNPPLSKDESNLLIYNRLLADHLLLHLYDPRNHKNEGLF
jgi:hypothetical protein